MPVPVAAKVGIVAASVAVAAAIAIYEIPEVRRAAEDLRRRIAIALHSLGDNVDPNREPRFNRPEDAEGFYQSHDVDADEETRRRQREELMYWNMRREEQQQRDQQEEARQRTRGSSFDDFLQPDRAGDSGTFVYNTGANAWDADSSNVLRRRGNPEGVRGLNAAAILANPFSDEYAIELEDRAQLLSATARDEAMSDIYNATPRLQSASPVPVASTTSEVLFDFAAHTPPAGEPTTTGTPAAQPPRPHSPTTTAASSSFFSSRSATLDRELADDEYMTAGQDDRHPTTTTTADDAYASIQAWARNSAVSNGQDNDDNNNNTRISNNAGFYSPLPTTPQAPVSEPELINEGQLTPADSASVVDVGGEEYRFEEEDDGMSETDASGVATPTGSWSEVGSVVSESSEDAVRA